MEAKVFIPSDGGLASQLFWMGRGLKAIDAKPESLLFGHSTSKGLRKFELDKLFPGVSSLARPGWLPVSMARKLAGLAGYQYLDDINPTQLGIELTAQLLRGPEASEVARQIFLPTLRHNQIAVHFRAGDYRNNSHTNSIHGMIHKDWFTKGVESLLHAAGLETIERVKVFSDEPDYAALVLQRELGAMVLPVVFSPLRKIEEEMAECASSTHFLGSNSGISFWIAIAREVMGSTQSLTMLPETWFKTVNAEVKKWMIGDQFAPLRSLKYVRFVATKFSDS